MWYIHIMEYYPAITKNQMQKHTIAWTNPEKIILSERSQMQKVTYCAFHLHEILRIDKTIETETRLAVSKRWRERVEECTVLLGEKEIF